MHKVWKDSEEGGFNSDLGSGILPETQKANRG